jgi:hypothetical protein
MYAEHSTIAKLWRRGLSSAAVDMMTITNCGLLAVLQGAPESPQMCAT